MKAPPEKRTAFAGGEGSQCVPMGGPYILEVLRQQSRKRYRRGGRGDDSCRVGKVNCRWKGDAPPWGVIKGFQKKTMGGKTDPDSNFRS